MSLNWLNVELRGFSVRIMVKTVFVFLFIISMGSGIYSKCLSRDESYKRFVEKTSLAQSYEENEKSIILLKKHLRCWKDKEVMIKLARFYIKMENFYLAKQVYEEAGAERELQLLETILKDFDTPENKNKFMQQSQKISTDLYKNAKEQKQLAITFSIVGSLFAGAGIGLFLNGKVFGGYDPKIAYYPLIFAGFSLIGGGIINNYSAEYKTAKADTYLDIANNHYAVGSMPSHYYQFTEKETQTRKKMIKTLRVHGTSLIILSVPLFITSAFSMYDAYQWFFNGEPLSDDLGTAITLGLIAGGFTIAGELATIALGAACLVGGITMIVYSNKWEKATNNPKSVIELTNISPMINPVSKTYGLALGFSF
jgi:hypothetical protein